MPVADGRCQIVEPVDLFHAKQEPVSGGVFLHTRDPASTWDRSDVLTLGEKPSKRDLWRGGTGLGGNCLDFVHNTKVALEALTDEAGVLFAPVIVRDVINSANLTGEKPMTQGRIRDEAYAQLT